MISDTIRDQIETFATRVAKEFQPEKIILFGSHAYGDPTGDSDVDLLVIMPLDGKQPYQQAVEIRQRIPRRFPLDLLVRTPSQIQARLRLNDFFIQEILGKGEVLYANGNSGVDR